MTNYPKADAYGMLSSKQLASYEERLRAPFCLHFKSFASYLISARNAVTL